MNFILCSDFRAGAQAVSRWPRTSDALARARISPCGNYGGQSDTGIGLSPSSSVFFCQYNSTIVRHAHISPEG
jgi:hypothetical protein